MSDFKYILILFLGAIVTACQSPKMVEERLVLAFGETMFGDHGSTYDRTATGDKDLHLAKWHSSLDVSVVEGATDENTALVEATLEQFAELTGLEINLMEPNNESAQLRIYFSSKKDFVINDNERAACFAHSRSDHESRLEMAEVHVSLIDDGEWQTGCLVHELLHAFGWRGHTHRVRSAISYMHGESELTRWDAYLMKTLYDPRLESGISKTDAMPKVRAILHELVKEG
ncbi:MAG: DUF2927 domain-containing protein [Gammaproteobacteria bacterium]|nr:DUF2927 domain-containing protein [Gammaproteobacteria bacterium]